MNACQGDSSYHDSGNSGIDSSQNYQAGFLVTLLLRYPELASVRVKPDSSSLVLSFLLRTPPERTHLQVFENQAKRSLNLLTYMEASPAARAVHIGTRHEGPLTVLELGRDLASLKAEEFPLIMDVIQKVMGNILLTEEEESVVDYPAFGEGTLSLSQRLELAKSGLVGADLIGVRHDGRILVFSAE